MMQRIVAPLFACLVLLAASGCQRAEPGSDLARKTEPDATRRFFSGRARPGEFQQLRDLPNIPPTFEEPQR